MKNEDVQILVICRHTAILQTILRLIGNKPEWAATGMQPGEEVLNLIKNQTFDLVLLGAGIQLNEDQQIRQNLSTFQPGVPVIQHYGGGSGLLYAEIYQALNNNWIFKQSNDNS